MKLATALIFNYAVSTVLSLQATTVKPEGLKNVLSRILTNLIQTKANLRVGGTIRDWLKLRGNNSSRLTNDAIVDNTLYMIEKTSTDLKRFTHRQPFVFGKPGT